MTAVLGIDISKWDGIFDAARAKAAGLGFVYARASQGTSYTDPNYLANRTAARAASLLFGSFHYLDCTVGNGTEQADFFCSLLDGRDWLAPVVDFEDRSPSVTPAIAIQFLRDFVAEMKARGFKRIVLYTSAGYWEQYGDPSDPSWAEYPLWQADYSIPIVPMKPWAGPAAVQYTPKGNGPADGVQALDVDGDWCNDLSLIEAVGNQPIAPAPTPTPAPAPAPLAAQYTVTAADLNLRSGGDIAHPVIGCLLHGATVEVDQVVNGWAHVKAEGWVNLDYLAPA